MLEDERIFEDDWKVCMGLGEWAKEKRKRVTEWPGPLRSQATSGDLERVNYFGDINFRENSRSRPATKEEIFEKKAITIILNALHQMNWPHLWRNDTWTVSSQLTTTHKASKRSWWDKHPRDFVKTQQVEGWDVEVKDYIRKWPP